MTKRHAPATLRNRDAIAAVLRVELPGRGTVLEVASGSGEHAVYFAEQFPALTWQPSDYEGDALASIDAYREECGLENVLPAMRLDAAGQWPEMQCAAILCCNMVHVSPWSATEGLIHNAGHLLAAEAPLILYGPYLEEGVPTAVSNMEFDRGLRARNADWGIRDVADVDALATNAGFRRSARHAMPANNLMLVYRK